MKITFDDAIWDAKNRPPKKGDIIRVWAGEKSYDSGKTWRAERAISVASADEAQKERQINGPSYSAGNVITASRATVSYRRYTGARWVKI